MVCKSKTFPLGSPCLNTLGWKLFVKSFENGKENPTSISCLGDPPTFVAGNPLQNYLAGKSFFTCWLKTNKNFWAGKSFSTFGCEANNFFWVGNLSNFGWKAKLNNWLGSHQRLLCWEAFVKMQVGIQQLVGWETLLKWWAGKPL